MIAVLVPVLNRPHRAAPVAESIREATTVEHRIIFLCSPGDRQEIRACEHVPDAETVVVPFSRRAGDYARKINYGVSITEEPWLFQAADDLRFHVRWDTAALGMHERSGRRVIGTNDLGNREVLAGLHSTHSLVARSYVEEHGTADAPGLMLHEGYDHNFCDTEMIQTAIARREFVFARTSKVEHLHPHWRKATKDRTYRLGLRGFERDRDRYYQRRVLWRGGGQGGGVGTRLP